MNDHLVRAFCAGILVMFVVFGGGLVLLTRAVEICRALIEHRPFPPLWPASIFDRMILACGAAFFGALLYAALVEPYRPVVTKIEMKSAKLKSPLRLVFLSDTHLEQKERWEGVLPGLVSSLRPDLIIFGGDAVNNEHGVEKFRKLIKQLAGTAPVAAVKGNWEAWWFTGFDLYSGTGVDLLEGAPVAVKGREDVMVAGFSVLPRRTPPGSYAAEALQALAGIADDKFTVFVHHFPETALMAAEKGVDLALSGDTHGGQLRLPFIGALVRISRFGSYLDIGPHAVRNGLLYVSRGLGLEGGPAPRLRFLCPPEIVLFEISPAS